VEGAACRRTVDVLVAKGDEELRRSLGTGLNDAGYNVRFAGNAVGASLLIFESAPGAMVVDAEMRGMDVFKFIAAIRSARTIPYFPVIFLTERPEDAIRARELGAACVVKPVQIDRLLAGISSNVSAPPPVLRVPRPVLPLAKASDAHFRRAAHAQVL